MNKPLYNCLYLNQLKIAVYLGTSKEERCKKQIVEASLAITFHTLPKACMTDKLQDTVCYATLIESIHQFCGDRSFQLIEHLGYQLHCFVKQQIEAADIRLQIKKKPAIEALEHCIFELSDGVIHPC